MVRRPVTLAVVIAIVALAVSVSASSLLGDGATTETSGHRAEHSAGSDDLVGAHVPPAGALPGRLWLVSAAPPGTSAPCRMRALDLGELRLEPPGELEHCTLVDVSADGRYGVASDKRLRLALVDLTGRPERVRDLEPSLQDRSPRTRSVRAAAIARDGSRVAWCSSVNETTALTIDARTEQRFLGCDPRFSPSGELLTRTVPPLPEAVLVEGEPLLDESDFRNGLDLPADGEASLLAYDIGEDGSLVTKVRRFIGQPQPTLQLWDRAALAEHHRVRGLEPILAASGIELSPDSQRVAFGWPGLLVGVLDVGFDRMGFTSTRGPFAWSPDGRWLAIGEASQVSIYARGGEAPTYVLPVDPLMLRWTQ